jgi:hypothetical protein
LGVGKLRYNYNSIKEKIQMIYRFLSIFTFILIAILTTSTTSWAISLVTLNTGLTTSQAQHDEQGEIRGRSEEKAPKVENKIPTISVLDAEFPRTSKAKPRSQSLGPVQRIPSQQLASQEINPILLPQSQDKLPYTGISLLISAIFGLVLIFLSVAIEPYLKQGFK